MDLIEVIILAINFILGLVFLYLLKKQVKKIKEEGDEKES